MGPCIICVKRNRSLGAVFPFLFLFRSRLDMNREILQGAQGFPAAEATYNEYHDKIAEVKAGLGSRGLLIDLHGQVSECETTSLDMSRQWGAFFPHVSVDV